MAGAKTTRCIKYTLIAVDLIILLSGIIMLIAGSVVQAQINSQKLSFSIGGFSLQAGSIICIIFGILIFIFSFMGLFASIKDSHRFLVLYSVVMSLILLIQFITGVTGLGVKNSSMFNNYVEDVFKKDFILNTTLPIERDFYQEKFKCCGWNGFEDYLINGTLQAPKSCCFDQLNCTENESDKKKIFSGSCGGKLIEALQVTINVACGILVTFSVFNFISILFSALLARQIRSGYQYT